MGATSQSLVRAVPSESYYSRSQFQSFPSKFLTIALSQVFYKQQQITKKTPTNSPKTIANSKENIRFQKSLKHENLLLVSYSLSSNLESQQVSPFQQFIWFPCAKKED